MDSASSAEPSPSSTALRLSSALPSTRTISALDASSSLRHAVPVPQKAAAARSAPGAAIRLIIAGEHALLREGIRMLCASQTDLCVIGEAVDGVEAVDLAEQLQPDVLVIELGMRRMNSLQATMALRRRASEVRVLFVGGHEDDPAIREVLRAGACGYALTRSPAADLLTGIRHVAEGRAYLDPALGCTPIAAFARRHASNARELSQREAEVLRLTAWGYRNTELAARLGISVKTVEVHKSRGFEKLGIEHRVELTRFALLAGWFTES